MELLTWFLFVVAVLSVCERLGTNCALTSKLPVDDWLVLATLVGENAPDTYAPMAYLRKATYLPQCISISIAASSGPGQASVSLTRQLMDNALKV